MLELFRGLAKQVLSQLSYTPTRNRLILNDFSELRIFLQRIHNPCLRLILRSHGINYTL